jgi:hypothetical protein
MRKSDEISIARLSLALVALAACAVAQWYIRRKLYWPEASPAFVAAALVAGWFLGRPANPSTLPGTTRTRGRLALWLGISLALAGLAVYGFAIRQLIVNWHVHFDTAAPLTVAGIALWSAGLALCSPSLPDRPWPRWETVAFVAVLLIGLFARFYRYDYYPPDGVCAVEEPQSGQATYLILHHGGRPWEFLGDRWLAVPTFALFGANLTTLRLPYTVVSWLTLIPFYLLVRALVMRPAALFATALFAVSSWHLLYARLAHAIFPTTLIAVLVLYLSVRAHQRGGLGVFPWIGFLCSYTLYTYAGYRGTPVFAAVFFAISFLIHVRDWYRAGGAELAAARRKVAIQSVGFVLALIAFIGPILVLQPRLKGENTGHFFEAAKRSVINTGYFSADLSKFLPQLWDRTLMAFKLFNHLGDGSETFNLPAEPMLDPITGVLMAVGLAYCVILWRHRWQGYFAFVFLALLTAGGIIVGNFDPRRLQGIIPLIFVMIAFAADRVAQAGTARLGGAARAVLLSLCAVVTAATFYLNWDLFFVRTINDPRVRMAFQNRFTVALRYLHSLPDNAYMLFLSDVPYFFMPSDLEWMRGHRIPGAVTSDLLPVFQGQRGRWEGRDLRILMQEPYEHEAIARLLQKRFPGMACIDASHPDRPAQSMTGCDVPEDGGVPFAGGIRARYFRINETEPFLERLEPAISFAFMPDICSFPQVLGKVPCRVEWEGEFEVTQPGPYVFQPESRHGALSVWLDGQPLAREMDLAAGRHQLRAEARFATVNDEAQDGGARLLWRPSNDSKWELVPFASPAQ